MVPTSLQTQMQMLAQNQQRVSQSDQPGLATPVATNSLPMAYPYPQHQASVRPQFVWQPWQQQQQQQQQHQQQQFGGPYVAAPSGVHQHPQHPHQTFAFPNHGANNMYAQQLIHPQHQQQFNMMPMAGTPSLPLGLSNGMYNPGFAQPYAGPNGMMMPFAPGSSMGPSVAGPKPPPSASSSRSKEAKGSRHASSSSSSAASRGRNPTSKFRGVYWNKTSRAWRARIWVNGKSEHIGNFDNEREAALGFDRRARELRGARAQLNLPELEDSAIVMASRRGSRHSLARVRRAADRDAQIQSLRSPRVDGEPTSDGEESTGAPTSSPIPAVSSSQYVGPLLFEPSISASTTALANISAIGASNTQIATPLTFIPTAFTPPLPSSSPSSTASSAATSIAATSRHSTPTPATDSLAVSAIAAKLMEVPVVKLEVEAAVAAAVAVVARTQGLPVIPSPTGESITMSSSA